MNLEQFEAAFEKYDDEYIRFERVENKRSNRPDLHAFMLLDSLVPGNRDIIIAAERNKIWIDIDVKTLATVITEEQILELVRCGIHYQGVFKTLAMFAFQYSNPKLIHHD